MKRAKHHKKKKMEKIVSSISEAFMKDMEKITDELISELHSKNGWDLEEVRRMQAMGLFYCRKSNSFFSRMHYGF